MATHAEKERLERWRQTDFYAVLGVEASSTTSEVKKGFRKVALTCHPDKVAAQDKERATRHFQLIAEAYDVLSKDASRRQYDGVRPRRTPPPPFASFSYPNRAASGGGGGGGSAAPRASAPGDDRRGRPAADVYREAAEDRRKADAEYNARIRRDSNKGPTFKAAHDPYHAQSHDSSEGGWHRCDGCDNRHKISDLKRCKECSFPHSAGLLCKYCDMCAGCVTNDADERFSYMKPQQNQPQPPPRGNVPRAQRQAPPEYARPPPAQAAPKAEARPLHENLTEFWTRADRYMRPKAGDYIWTDKGIAAIAKVGVSVSMGRPKVGDILTAKQREMIEEAREWDTLVTHGGLVKQNGQAPVKVRAAPPAEAAQSGAVQRHAREPTPEPDLDEDLDNIGILMAMGFSERRVKEALQRSSTLEAAVDYLMLQGDQGVYTEYIQPVMKPAAEGIYGAAERAGVAPVAHQAVNALHEAVQPAARGIYGVAEKASAGLYGAVFKPMAEKIYGENKPEAPADDLCGTLVALGFTEIQAKAAAGRCSSVEAAIDWISSHPELAS